MAVGSVGAQQSRQRIRIIPVAVQAMAEGIETATEQSKIFKAVKAFDVVITMGCGDRCSYLHGKRY